MLVVNSYPEQFNILILFAIMHNLISGVLEVR